MNTIIRRANADSAAVGMDFLERLMDDILWSIENPSAPMAIDYVRDATDAERDEAKPLVERILQSLIPTSMCGAPAVFDGDRARISPEYANRDGWVAFDPSILLYMPRWGFDLEPKDFR